MIILCFVIGFVIIAGAGANLKEQFGFPTWLGALIWTFLVIVVSFLDFEKITGVIGIFTPIIIVMITIIAIKLISKKFADDKNYTKKDKSEFHNLGEKSIIDTSEIKKDIHDFVEEKDS